MSVTFQKIIHAANGVMDFFLPSLCIVCDDRVDSSKSGFSFICQSCLEKMECVELPMCPICGFPQLNTISGKYCKHCPPRPLYFDICRGAVLYNEVAAEIIKALKYSRITSIANWMGNLMFLRLETLLSFDVDLVTVVPLHYQRELNRGFNQSELVARRLCQLKGWKFAPETLCRVRATRKQSELSEEDRARNVRDAFEVPNPDIINGKNVMLIDDVFTTGSSSNECARMLRSAGAHRIIIYTFARA